MNIKHCLHCDDPTTREDKICEDCHARNIWADPSGKVYLGGIADYEKYWRNHINFTNSI